MKKNTRITLLALTTAVSMMAAACGGASNQPAPAAKPQDSGQAPAKQEEPVTIKAFMSAGQFNKGNFGFRMITEEFAKKYPHIKVELTVANGKQWQDTFNAMVASNDLPDVINPAGFDLTYLQSRNLVQPLEGLVQADMFKLYSPDAFQEGINKADGKIYSIPRIIAKRGRVLVYNKDVMQKAGLDPNKPPQTWDELFNMSKQVTEKSGGAFGFGGGFKDHNNVIDVLTMAQAFQPTLDSITGFDYQKGKYDLDSPNIIKAVEFLIKMKDAGVLHPNSGMMGNSDYQGLMANKQIAFGFNQHWVVRVNEFDIGGVKDFGVAPIPVPEKGMQYFQNASSASSEGFYITKQSTGNKAKAAAKLIEFIGSKEYYGAQMKQDLLLPPLPSLMDDAANFSRPELKQLADAFKTTVVERPPLEAKKEAREVKLIETKLAPPKPDWWEVVQQGLFGKGDWKAELTKVNNAYNARLDEAIKKGQEQGLKVSKEDFTFSKWDGKKDYKP